MRRVLPLVLLVVLAAAPAAARESADLQRREREIQGRLEKLLGREGEVLKALEAVQQQEALESGALAAAEKKVRDAEKALAFVKRDREETRRALERKRAELGPRLVARYKLGRAGYLPLLLSAGSADELRRRQYLLTRVVRADMEALEDVRRLEHTLAEQAATLEQGHTALETLRRAAAERLDVARRARREREATLSAIRREKRLQRQALVELARAREALDRVVVGLRPDGAAGRGLAGLKGRLPLPTPGAIAAGFGTRTDPRYDTVTVHKGVDIRAPKGAKVRAVAAGRVVYADWMRGYGNLVILDHGDGYHTLMAHLDRMTVAQGAEVPAGEVVGYVGDTGSLDGARLYFEIREKGHAVNPEPWFGR